MENQYEGKQKPKESCRKWFLTINNPEKHGFKQDVIKAVLGKLKGDVYYCMCDEIGRKTQTYHTHIFIHRPSPLTFKQLKSMFPPADIRWCRGTNQENRDYVRKEGKWKDTDKEDTNLKETFFENGDCPEEMQGKRNDLHDLYAMIKDDFTTYDILEVNPNYMDKLDKIDQVRELLRYEEFKDKRRLDIQVEYWYGEAGAGKSRAVRDKYGDSKVYCVSDSKNPWDGYRGQDVVLFDDFRADMFSLNDLLRWLDVYPVELPCRYRNKQACYTKVYFTSNIPFDGNYKWTQEHDAETWRAFCRRFHCIKQFKKGENGPHVTEYTSIEEYLERYKNEFVKLTPEQEKYIQENLGF